MAKGSQKRRNDLQKKVKAKLPHLNVEAWEYISEFKDDWIPEQLTNLPTTDDQETKRFLICFDYFKETECKLEDFNPTHARAFLRKLKLITDCEVRRKAEIIRHKLINNN